MIRVVARRLIIPCGDTGTFTIPILNTAQAGDTAILYIFDPLYRTTLLEKKITVPVSDDGTMTFSFVREDTINIEPSNRYEWDIKIIRNPVFDEEGHLSDGNTIDSYYSAFKRPVCHITE